MSAATIPAYQPDSSTRARILAAARRRFERFGYRRTNIAEIAKDAGLAVGTLYGHFTSKEDILLKITEEMDEAWLARARAALAQPGTALERFARLGQVSIENNEQNRLMGFVVARDIEMIPAPLLEMLHTRDVKRNVELIAEVLRDGMKQGAFRSFDPEKAAFIVFITGEALYRQHFYTYAELHPTFNDMMLNGLLTPSTDRHRPKSKRRKAKRKASR